MSFIWCYHLHHHLSVLPKGRSFTAKAGTNIAVLSKGRSSIANAETKVAVLLETNRCGSFPLLFALLLLLLLLLYNYYYEMPKKVIFGSTPMQLHQDSPLILGALIYKLSYPVQYCKPLYVRSISCKYLIPHLLSLLLLLHSKKPLNIDLLILQLFSHFIYVTTHSPTLPSLYPRHSSFSNPSVASPTSQLIQPSYVTGSSLTSPGEPPMA